MTEVRHIFSSPAGDLASLNVASSANPAVGTLATVPPPHQTKYFADLTPAPWPVSQSSADHSNVAAFQNQTATAPGQHGVPFEKSRRAAPIQRADTAPTAPAAAMTRPLTTVVRGDILDFLRTQRVSPRTLSSATAAAQLAADGTQDFSISSAQGRGLDSPV